MRNAKIDAFEGEIARETKAIIDEIPDLLVSGFRTLFLLERSKDGGHNKEERRTFNFAVVTNREELAIKLSEFLWLRLLYTEKDLRIYYSVNARSPKKATRNIMDAILDGLYADQVNRELIEKKVVKGARSYLMNPNAKSTNYFMLDVDKIVGRDIMGETLMEMGRLELKEIYRKPTRNGWHVVVEPFNPALWKCDAEIKKDGLLLLK